MGVNTHSAFINFQSRLALLRAQKEAAKQKERESSFDSSDSEYDSSSDDSEEEEGKSDGKRSGSDDEGGNSGEPVKKKRRGWMTDLGGVATPAEGDEERIISNIDSLPERTGEYVSSRVEPETDLLGNRVEKVGQLEEGDVAEVRVDHEALATLRLNDMKLKLRANHNTIDN